MWSQCCHLVGEILQLFSVAAMAITVPNIPRPNYAITCQGEHIDLPTCISNTVISEALFPMEQIPSFWDRDLRRNNS